MDADVTHGTLQQEKQDYIKGVLKLAKSRGFSVEIHGRVSSEELFRAMCRAKVWKELLLRSSMCIAWPHGQAHLWGKFRFCRQLVAALKICSLQLWEAPRRGSKLMRLVRSLLW